MDLSPLVGNGSKAVSVSDPGPLVRRSVIEPQPLAGQALGASMGVLWFIGQQAEDLSGWGFNSKIRDGQLRNFLHSEPTFLSALGIIVSRNTAFSWKLEGPESSVTYHQRALESCNWGRGWIDLWAKVSMDLYTQDSGAFIEIVREEDSETSRLVSLNHLDAARCWHTGVPESPVIYQDWRGRYHLLKWYQVVTLSDMPTPFEGLYGMQYCALTRFLRYAQILKNLGVYDDEKTGGRFQRAIHLVKGITTKQIEEAVAIANARLDNAGFRRFAPPAMAGSIDPTADVGHDTIDLAGTPEGFERDTQNKWYMAFLAMAFMEDYQTFAPLPGGGLGTSNQSQILNAKARGKGPGLFQKLVTHAMNFFILPSNVEFSYDEQDLEADRLDAEVRGMRASERASRVNSGEISVVIAQNRALRDGDLTQEEYDAMQEVDLMADTTIEDGSDPKSQLGSEDDKGLVARMRAQVQKEQAEKKAEQDFQMQQTQARFAAQQQQRPGQKEFDPSLDDERLDVEEMFAEALTSPFARVKERLVEVLSRDSDGSLNND